MGPPETATRSRKNQAADRHKRRAGQPRMRQCLLKGCDQRFHPRQPRQRYCSERCREAARVWSRFIAKAENIVFVGKTAVGRTGLASGLLMKALENGYRCQFI